jgi:thioredoxin 1
MAVIEVTDATFRREVLESELPVVVDFYADWCGPCKQISPALAALSEEWVGSVRFAKLDVDGNREAAQAYRISSIPAVLLFENGEVAAWSLGAKPAYLIERELGLGRRRRRDSGRGLLARISARFSR